MSKEEDSSSASALSSPSSPPHANGGTFSQLQAVAISSRAGSPLGAPVLVVNSPAEAASAPMVAVPCFLAPASILETPGFSGQFAMTHQAVLATVTAQAQMQLLAANPSQAEALSNSLPRSAPTGPVPLLQGPSPVLDSSVSTPTSTKPPPSSQKAQSAQRAVMTSSDDGYSWRKYGQKQVKTSDRTRSYYRCTNANCIAKKKVERCPDGREIEIIFRGKHNHDPPQKSKYTNEKDVRAPFNVNETLDPPSGEVNESDLLALKTERISGNETSEQQLYCPSDCEGDAALRMEEGNDNESGPKRRLVESHPPYLAPVLKTIKEPKVVVQSASDPACTSDGYRWRKYGQKLVKGNPNPRSYYRCTHNGCPVRKHVEKSSDDSKSILITYEGNHNHDRPFLKSVSDQHSRAPETSSHDRSKPADGELLADDKESMESAETLLSIGTNSSDDGIKPPLFSENCAAVPVHHS